MKVALIQMNISREKAVNLDRARSLIAEAARGGADFAVLPEMFCCEYRNPAFIENREPAGGAIHSMLSEAARENRIYLIGGSFPEEDGGRIYNSSFVFDRSGRQLARHRKAHLFDIDVDGGQVFRESDTFSPGNEITVFDTEFGKMGLEICFDIRFPELTRIMALEGALAVFCPAAFNMTTGPAHWELSFRGRAVENQLFTLACAPARDVNGRYISYANSMAVTPWGDVLARADAEETLLYADLDLSLIGSIRRQLPLLASRRADLYTLEPRAVDDGL
ncbi:MAG: carbon-nitrogen hydrolase family protein [Oscillospiraceae bacterium]